MALSSNTVWEIRSDGSDDNGGGFVHGASGTDYSQQAGAQLTVTDAVTSGSGVATLTSATGGFTAAMVGNVLRLHSGTNLTAGWYQITGYTDVNTVTLDRAPDNGNGGVSGATCKVGGALASIGVLNQCMVGGNAVWIRSGSYTITTSSEASGGPFDLGNLGGDDVAISGYGTVRGDGGRPTITVQSGVGSVSVFRLTSHRASLSNVVMVGNGASLSSGVASAFGSSDYFPAVVNCKASGFDDGFVHVIAIGCEAVDCGSTGFSYCLACKCYARNCSVSGFDCYRANECIADSCGVGFDYGYSGHSCFRCLAYGCTGDGFNEHDDTGLAVECVAVACGGYGFDFGKEKLVNCAGYNNTSGNVRTDTPTNINFTTLTANPFVNAAAGDFRLNSLSGGGALLLGAGITIPGQQAAEDLNPMLRGSVVLPRRLRILS
jgi:hypothetical protein